MSALTVRVHCCIGAAGAVVVVVAGIAVAAFADAVSILGDSVACLIVPSETGATTFGAGFGIKVLNSETGLSTATAGVCAPATAGSKLKAITVNEATMVLGDLKPNILHISLDCLLLAKH
jgi:hypothetical protein